MSNIRRINNAHLTLLQAIVLHFDYYQRANLPLPGGGDLLCDNPANVEDGLLAMVAHLSNELTCSG